MKIRKQHRRKHYRYNVNRKTLRRVRTSTGKIKYKDVKELWDEHKQPGKNFYEMGLSSDPNKTVPIPNFKMDRLQMVKIANGPTELKENIKSTPRPKKVRPKEFVAKKLEEDAKAPREHQLRLPKGLIKQLTYFMDKYQLNYKMMVNDRQNYDQWTWKQFRAKIRKFISIPEQFNEYLASKNLQPFEKLPWAEYDSESEWA